jgi:hypothetical protein
MHFPSVDLGRPISDDQLVVRYMKIATFLMLLRGARAGKGKEFELNVEEKNGPLLFEREPMRQQKQLAAQQAQFDGTVKLQTKALTQNLMNTRKSITIS